MESIPRCVQNTHHSQDIRWDLLSNQSDPKHPNTRINRYSESCIALDRPHRCVRQHILENQCTVNGIVVYSLRGGGVGSKIQWHFIMVSEESGRVWVKITRFKTWQRWDRTDRKPLTLSECYGCQNLQVSSFVLWLMSGCPALRVECV